MVGGVVVCDHTGGGGCGGGVGGILNIALFGVLKRVFKNPPLNGQHAKIMRAILPPKMSLFGVKTRNWPKPPFLGFFAIFGVF